MIRKKSFFISKRQYIIATLCLSTLTISCKKKENSCTEKTVSTATIQGNWKQDYKLDPEKVYFAPPNQYFSVIFKNDSFFLAFSCHTDAANPQKDSCSQFSWTEYVKGTYTLSNSKLVLNGVYTNDAYAVKTEGCHNIGAFHDAFQTGFCNETFILNRLNSSSNAPEYNRIRLVPKK